MVWDGGRMRVSFFFREREEVGLEIFQKQGKNNSFRYLLLRFVEMNEGFY